MNSTISTDKYLAVDTVLTSGITHGVFDVEELMTPYGLIYPVNRGWNLLRFIQGAKDTKELLSKEYLAVNAFEKASSAIYLDWDAKLWYMSITSDRTAYVTTIFNRLQQTPTPLVICREMLEEQTAVQGLNAAMTPGMSLKATIRMMEKLCTGRMALPHVLHYDQFRNRRPEGAKNLPSLCVSRPREITMNKEVTFEE